MLEVRSLNAWWGPAQVLFGLSLSVQSGEMVLLEGLNGAGKSTLLQAIMGIGPRAQGLISYREHALSDCSADLRARAGLGFVPENRRLFGELTVRQNLLLTARPKRSRAERAEQLEQVLALFPGLSQALDRSAAHLSGGQQQMLAIGRTLMTSPSILLLDEPCEGIAPVLVETIRDALLVLKKQGMAMLIAEQNALLADYADRVLTLTAGQLTAPTTP